MHFSSPHTQLVFWTCFLSGYLISIDVLMSLVSQIPFKQGDVQHNATRLFSFDSSPLSLKQRCHVSHRGSAAFSPWLLLAFLFNTFLQRPSRQSSCGLPASLKSCRDASVRIIHGFPQIKGQFTVLERQHRGPRGNLKKASVGRRLRARWNWSAYVSICFCTSKERLELSIQLSKTRFIWHPFYLPQLHRWYLILSG